MALTITHCMKKAAWEAVQSDAYWGWESVERCGFMHCTGIPYLWRVLPNFEADPDERVIVCMDADRLEAPVRWEDGGDTEGRLYPHVYGPINNSAVTMVLPYLKDAEGRYRKNPEFEAIADE